MRVRKASTRAPETKRTYLSQTDVPGCSLDQALRVPQAIADSYGKNPTRPLRVAQAMNMSPSSGPFRMLCGASIAYGLTEGGYNSDQIALTPLGRRIVAPTKEGDDLAARREAVLRPRVLREFLTRYDESKLPVPHIARNVLEEMGVPPTRAEAVFDLLIESARSVGFLQELKDHLYIDLDLAGASIDPAVEPGTESDAAFLIEERSSERAVPRTRGPDQVAGPTPAPARATSRVFITHGKNREIVGQLKDLLMYGGFTPVIAMENETTSKPLPDKIMDDMRSCSAAIIHVGPEGENKSPNPNVLIEIGAALALYGTNFILLVERGVTLPSNLQGLYEARYEGDKLDYESTMKLLKAFNDFRS